MYKIFLHINQNPYTLDITNYKLTFKKIRLSHLVYLPNTTSEQVRLKIYTSKFDRTLNIDENVFYFKILSVIKDNGIGYVNYYNCTDIDYIGEHEKYFTSCVFTFYENDTIIDSNYLSNNPIDLELTLLE